GGVLAVPPAPTSPAATAGGKVMLESVVLQGIELPRDLEDDVSATSAVATVRTAARHILLAAEAQGAGTAVASLDEDLDAVRKHRLVSPGPGPGFLADRLNGWGEDGDFFATVAGPF